MKKNQDVVLVLRNNNSLAFSLILTFLFSFVLISQSSKANQDIEPEELRKKIFGIYAHKAACKPLDYIIDGGLKDSDKKLNIFLSDLISGVQSGKLSKQIGLFHPRLKVEPGVLEEIIAGEKLKLGFPFSVSIHKIWALNSVDGSPGSLYCSEDEIKLWPQYSYPLQFGVWLQILGQNELGRIYTTVVPKDGKWHLGSFHYHQWTHKGKDFKKWFAEGQADLKEGLKEAAYVKYDIAAKLIDGKKEFYIPLMEQVKNYQNNILSKEKWEESVKSTLKKWNIIHLGTTLAEDGPGLIFRIQTEKEISGKAVYKECQTIGQELNKAKWFSKIKGIKCGFVLKGEPTHKDGFMGGVYISKENLKL